MKKDKISNYLIKIEKYILKNGVKDLMCETKNCNFWSSCDGTDEGKYCFKSEMPKNNECSEFMTEKQWDELPIKEKHPDIDLSKIEDINTTPSSRETVWGGGREETYLSRRWHAEN